MLETQQLNQFYGGSHVLWDVALEVPRGSCTCLIGRNGVGKTTLLKTLMGLLPASSGSIRFGSEELFGASVERRARLGIGYVPQGREIFPLLSVEENLRVGFDALPRNERTIPDRVFELFPVLHEMRGRRGGDLSGGLQQQLAIGRALVLRPKLLILDEPTEGIQPNVIRQIGDVIIDLNRSDGLTVLIVEQKLPFAQRVADRFCVMSRGRSVAAGLMADLDEALVQRHLSV
ncbi:MAG: urea ABC transporter ATP-binding subunit UrtE [Myxococcota bacterium]